MNSNFFFAKTKKNSKKGLTIFRGGGDILSAIQDEGLFASLAEFSRVYNSPVLSYKFWEGFFNYEFNF